MQLTFLISRVISRGHQQGPSAECHQQGSSAGFSSRAKQQGSSAWSSAGVISRVISRGSSSRGHHQGVITRGTSPGGHHQGDIARGSSPGVITRGNQRSLKGNQLSGVMAFITGASWYPLIAAKVTAGGPYSKLINDHQLESLSWVKRSNRSHKAVKGP